MPADEEIRAGDRFAFGKNWARFLEHVDETALVEAEQALRTMLDVDRLDGKTFCDVGSGSGLHAVAAARLGAAVRAFDYDPASVACTAELARRFDVDVEVTEGSALDEDFLAGLGRFDVVYSWGVLHHTGDMWRALDLVGRMVSPGGVLFLALYNDQGAPSRAWAKLKRLYNRSPLPVQLVLAVAVTVRFWGKTVLRDLLHGHPLRTWRGSVGRGMSPWTDAVDWAGGWPFEVVGVDPLMSFYQDRGFEPRRCVAVQGHGCNEVVFDLPTSRPGA